MAGIPTNDVSNKSANNKVENNLPTRVLKYNLIHSLHSNSTHFQTTFRDYQCPSKSKATAICCPTLQENIFVRLYIYIYIILHCSLSDTFWIWLRAGISLFCWDLINRETRRCKILRLKKHRTKLHNCSRSY